MAISGKRILLQNNQALRAKDQNGDVQDLLKLDTSGAIAGKIKEYIDAQDQVDQGEITELQQQMATKASQADLDSEELARAQGDQAARDYADLKIANLVGSAPELLNTLEELASAINENPNFASAISQQIGEKASQVDLDFLDGRVDAAESDIDGLEQSVATKAAQSDLSALSGRVNQAEADIVDLEGRMDSAESAIQSRASSASVVALDGRVGQLEATMPTKASQSDFDELEERMDSAESAILLKASLASLDSEISRAQVAETVLDGRLDIIEPKVSTLESEMDAVEARASSLEGRMDLAESEMDAVEDRASSLEGRMDLAESSIATKASQAGLVSAEGRIGALEVTMPTKASQVDMDALEGRMDLAESSIATKASQAAVNIIEGRVNTAEADIDQLQLDVALKADSAAVSASLAVKADLVAGKIPQSQIPAIAIVDTFEASSEAGMLALSSAEQGDVCIRSDINKTFILSSGSYSVLSNWKELKTPTDSVLSVNGYTGSVTLTKSDVGLGSVDNTSDIDKPISAAQATALAGKASTSLSNLASTSVNADLLPSANGVRSIGSSVLNWMTGWFTSVRTATIQAVVSALTINTPDSSSAATGAISIKTGNGSAANVSSGSLTLGTGAVSGSGTRGDIILDVGSSGAIRPLSPNNSYVGTTANPFSFAIAQNFQVWSSGASYGGFQSGPQVDGQYSAKLTSYGPRALILQTIDSQASQDSKKVVITSGIASSNYNSGDVQIKTGSVSGTGIRGKVSIDALSMDMNSAKIVSVSDPTSAQDASTKNYTDTQREAAKSYADSGILVEKTRAQSAEQVLGGRLNAVEALQIQKMEHYTKTLSTPGDLVSIDVGYAIVGQPMVMLEGVLGRPGTEFTVSGSVITFSGEWLYPSGVGSVALGDVIHVYYMRQVAAF